MATRKIKIEFWADDAQIPTIQFFVHTMTKDGLFSFMDEGGNDYTVLTKDDAVLTIDGVQQHVS